MISKEEVKHIAKLSRLELGEQETEKMQKDLSSILDYFNLLKKAPKLKESKKTTSSEPVSNQTRQDMVIEGPTSLAGDLVEAAPDKKDGYVKVKAIF